MSDKTVTMRIEVDEREMKELVGRLPKPNGSDLEQSDVFNIALSLLRWAVQQSELGREVGSLDANAATFRKIDLERLCVLTNETPIVVH